MVGPFSHKWIDIYAKKEYKTDEFVISGWRRRSVRHVGQVFPGIEKCSTLAGEMDAAVGVIKRFFAMVGKPGCTHAHNTAYTTLKNDVLDALMCLPLSVRKKAGYQRGVTVTIRQARQSTKRKNDKVPTPPGKKGRKKKTQKDHTVSPKW